MSKKFTAIISILCAAYLLISACQIRLLDNAQNTSSQTAAAGKSAENTENTKSEDTTEAPEPNDGTKVRRDEEGLVAVTIKDGMAEIEFDLDAWDAMYGMAGYTDYYGYLFGDGDIQFKKGPFSVMLYYDGQNIADACAGKLPSGYEEDYPVPTVVFLLEDGTLEYARADLAAANAQGGHYTNPLHGLGGIVSLAYVSGEAIYAVDKEGSRYDAMLYGPEEDRTDENRFSWRVEPTLEYERIYYCSVCDVFGPKDHEGDILDPETGRVTRDKNIIKDGWLGHGVWSMTWLYDEDKKLYGWYSSAEEGDEYKMFTRREFLEAYPWLEENYLIAFKSVDSGKVKEITHDWGVEYDFDAACQNGKGKYAFAYNLDFISDFIYDYDVYHNGRTPAYAAAAQLDGKWGVIGGSGEILLPFVFGHILFIDENTAFAKYEGKYGIVIFAQG